jgi:hypothetical protein
VVALTVTAQDEGVVPRIVAEAHQEESTMSGFPHPVNMTFEAEQHRLDLLQQAERDRQRLLAELDVEQRQQWLTLSAVVLLLMSVAFVLALNGAVS